MVWIVRGIRRGNSGLEAKEGDTIYIQNTNADLITGVLWGDGYPVLLDHEGDNKIRMVLERKNFDLKGLRKLEIRSYKGSRNSGRIEKIINIV